jgi:Calcineurin-like phosphoesterase
VLLALVAVAVALSPAASPRPTPAAAATTTTRVTAEADTFVTEAAPDRPGGAAPRLLVDGSPRRQAFVRFQVPEVDGTLVRATLRLHVADVAGAGSDRGGTVAGSTDVTWQEATTTWRSRPPIDRPAVGPIGTARRDHWVARGVTGLVEPGAPVTLSITSASADDVAYDARGSGAGPRLVLFVERPSPAIVVAAVGDMVCGPGAPVTPSECHHRAVSDLVVGIPDLAALLPLGDLQYNFGALAAFQSEYDPTYGRGLPITHPVAGNHEYLTPDAAGYFDYFGAAAGTRGEGWYSFDLGTSWHLVALNSNCEQDVSCAPGSPQVTWLRADLEANDRPCVLAYWHHPRYSSGLGNTVEVAPFLWALQQHRAEIVLAGHVHNYERFGRQHPDGTPAANGARHFVVGTGGRSFASFGTVRRNSQVRIAGRFGVLELTLLPSSYRWAFVDEDGVVRDSGEEPCR